MRESSAFFEKPFPDVSSQILLEKLKTFPLSSWKDFADVVMNVSTAALLIYAFSS